MGWNSQQLDIVALMDSWSVSIRLENLEAASSIHEELKVHINEFRNETAINFNLLESRYYANNDMSQSKLALAKAKKLQGHFNDIQHYYLHLTEGMTHYYEDQYYDAIASYEKAEKLLHHLEDPVEKGEFHLRIAMTYYNLDITTLSALHAEKAIEYFKPYKTFEFLLARTEMLQGLNYVDLLNYENAEEYLHRAKSSFKNTENLNFVSYTNLNLGDLYVKKDLPGTAIRYLEEALQSNPKRGRLKILYLLADCYWKTNQPSKALEFYLEGFQASIENEDITKKWEFAMLHKKYEDRNNFESVWQEGIEYFQRVNDVYNVRLFSRELAQYYTKRKYYELATKYYLLALI